MVARKIGASAAMGCHDRLEPLLRPAIFGECPAESRAQRRRTRVLVAYYSRTDRTRTIAQYLARELGAHVEVLTEAKERARPRPSWRCAADALFARSAPLSAACHDATTYDLVVVGSPVWYAALSSPVRSYLAEHAGSLRNLAFFVTCGGWRPERALRQMLEVSRCAPRATLTVRRRDFWDGRAESRSKAFAATLGAETADWQNRYVSRDPNFHGTARRGATD